MTPRDCRTSACNTGKHRPRVVDLDAPEMKARLDELQAQAAAMRGEG